MAKEAQILRIIDANVNRAMEGLRVIEEVARFFLEDIKSTSEIKLLRNALKNALSDIPKKQLLINREALKDVGNGLYTKEESKRNNFSEIFVSNIKRAEEAIRCLEEFSKLINPKIGIKIKGIRFKLYELEKQLTPKIIKHEKMDFTLYVVTDPATDHLKTAHKALSDGVKIVQFRDKHVSEKEYFHIAKKIHAMAKKYKAVFIVNDYWELMNALDADGVHLGQEDLEVMPLNKVRKEIGEDKIIGVSTHSYEQALKAEKLGADYISVGPIFVTPSKPGRKPVGIALLKKVINRVNIPVVAIGGIDVKNYDQVVRSGCQRFAVIRAAKDAKKILGGF
ncbi:MAG: thiamine phosphate synthase [Candidatus Margulisiibacteriota bacterium]